MRRHGLVALLGWFFLVSGASADAGVEAEKSQDDNAPQYVQFEYCVERLLSPIRALAGQMPPDSEKQRALMFAQPAPISSTILQLALGQPTPLAAPPAQAPASVTQVSQIGAFETQMQALSRVLERTHRGTKEPLTVETLIATLPDPIDSGLVYSFETMLQALRLGVEAADERVEKDTIPGGKNGNEWFRDRSFLPWADRQVGSTSRAQSEVCRKSVPGVLLFRNSSLTAPRVLMVLVVGETPTSGVHGAALLNALRMSAAFSSDNSESTPIRIAGPTFSGSAYSLRVLLQSFAGTQHRNFEITSGTASGSGVQRLLTSGNEPARFSYAATTVTEADADCAYLRFLHGELEVEAHGRTLHGVATLQESGTEFGVSPLSSGKSPLCDYDAELTLSFPMHVSMLRDAYEDMERRERQPSVEIPVLRANGLDVTLGETRTALELEANPSPKTRSSVDTMLSRVLGEISRRSIRHVSIHATDVGDAVFLARRIRDVAPDVRVAFFEPDDILLHPEHRAELLGSFVVSPYPFLGISDFETRSDDSKRMGFPNASAQGLFNAVLSLRDLELERLLAEKPLVSGKSPGEQLAIWVSTIARTGLVPINLQLPPQSVTKEQPQPKLPLAAARDLPRTWTFAFLVLALIFGLDIVAQSRSAGRLSNESLPTQFQGGDERSADRAIGRTKWWLYSAIRRSLFVVAFFYVFITYLLAAIAKSFAGPALSPHYVAMAASAACLLWALWNFGLACARFSRNYLGFARYVGYSNKPVAQKPAKITLDELSESSSYRRRAMQKLIGAEAAVRQRAARHSFWQLTFTTVVALGSACVFMIMVLLMVATPGELTLFTRPTPVATLTMYVLRTMPLMSGVSPATPLLLCLACVYVCTVGRMARLMLAHSLSRIAPHDGENDLASTPIRLVLYPHYDGSLYDDEGFTQTERDLLNSIWRPIAAKYALLAALAVFTVPAVLFWLKPVSTIEEASGTHPLRAALLLGAVSIGIVFLQLLQYWNTLTRLLQRTAVHPLAPAFAKLPAFARNTIEGQLSGSSDMLLRWVASARLLDSLVERLPRSRELEAHAHGVKPQLQAAMRLAHAPTLQRAKGNPPTPHDAEAAALAERVIGAAVEVSKVLPQLREARSEPKVVEHTSYLAVGQDVEEITVRAPIVPPPSNDPAEHVLPRVLSSKQAQRPASAEDTGRREPISDTAPAGTSASVAEATYEQAQAFVATVAALLIQRHVRQLRYFMSTLVGASMLLLLAVSSYPFEPYRLLLSCMWVIVCAIVSVGLWIYMQLNRDPLIRSMSHDQTRSLSLSSGLVWRVFAWAIIPLLSVAAAQFPNFANLLLPLISPFLRALK